ncbi:MAG TPA: zinc ribbon domain-containing protein [Armatimonadetes bacterium]|nr:zinc ribbon domain-containing protein [Armatimonadota bacterium]
MTYEYNCNDCGAITILECSVAEKDEREKSLTCEACGSRNLQRIFNAFIARKGGSNACSTCTTASASSCST